MYYILVAVLALLIFLLFVKALGAVLKGIVTVVFLVAVILAAVVFFKSLSEPVDIFGLYKVDKFIVTKVYQK
jgi:hypothetical protein